MALLKFGRGLPALQQLSRAVASSGAGRIGILDQPSSRLAQFWWSSTSAGSDGKDKPKGQDDEAAAAAGAAAEGAQARAQADSQAQPSGPQSGPMTEGGTLLTPEEMMLQLTAAQASSKQLKEQVRAPVHGRHAGMHGGVWAALCLARCCCAWMCGYVACCSGCADSVDRIGGADACRVVRGPLAHSRREEGKAETGQPLGSLRQKAGPWDFAAVGDAGG